MEILGLYDHKKKRLNKSIVRGNSPENGEHILVSVVFIKNKDGKYLIQKTSLEKGGLYSSIIYRRTPIIYLIVDF